MIRMLTIVAAAALLAGCAAATSAPVATGSAVAQAPGAGDVVGFTDYTDNDGPASTVLLTGAIGDFGQAMSVNPDGTPNPGHTGQLSLQLRNGTFRISTADLDKKFVSAMANFPTNTTTCSGTESVTGTAPIVAGSGTGAYQGISGTFTLTLSLAEIDQTSGCGKLLKQLIVITGTGKVAH